MLLKIIIIIIIIKNKEKHYKEAVGMSENFFLRNLL